MSVRLLNLPDDAKVLPHTFGFEDDFLEDHVRWTDTAASTGTAAIDADGVGGLIVLTTAAADNDDVYRHTPENFKFAADKPMVATARLQFAEAATNAANVVFGFGDGIAADFLTDNGGGPKTTLSGALIYKKDGETRWRCRTSVGTDYEDTELDFTAGGSGYHTLRVEVTTSPDGSEIVARYWIDTAGGNALIQAREYNVHPSVPLVEHRVAIGTPTEMAVVVGVKAGTAAAQALTVDYVSAYGCR